MEAGKICVSVAAADAAAVHAAVLPVREQVDVVEVRLDAMPVPEVAKCYALIRKPLLFTHRPFWEGGMFNGFEEDRLDPLFTAVELQAAYLDYELRADPLLRRQLLDALQSAPTRMIISWHDFTATPTQEDLNELLAQMMDSGAHIGKIVTTAHGLSDVLRVLRLQEKAQAARFPLSCFCMGEPGRISRFATLFMGGYMSYGAPDRDQATAPGQLTVGQLDRLCRVFQENNHG